MLSRRILRPLVEARTRCGSLKTPRILATRGSMSFAGNSGVIATRAGPWTPGISRRCFQTTREVRTAEKPDKKERRRAVNILAEVVGGLVVLGAMASFQLLINVAFFGRKEPSKLSSWQPVYGDQPRKAVEELRKSLGDDAVSVDEEDLRRHGFVQRVPSVPSELRNAIIVYPKTTEQVIIITKFCTKHRIPMVPFSGGSSLEGNFSMSRGGVCIDMAYMDRILEVRVDDMDVTVQPGVRWMDLNEKIKDSNLFFPVDPGPTAMIGGMVGTSCSGTNAFRYGTMRDWVVNLTVVLADGRVITTKRRPRKSAAGYNLNHLFVGSEGTLGIVTEVTLKLAPIPQATSVAVVTFPTLRDAASTAMSVIRSGIPVGAMEIMDEVSMNVVNRAGTTHKTWQEVPTLFFKFTGTHNGVKENAHSVLEIAEKHSATSFESTADPEEQKLLWSARKENLWSMLSLRGKGDAVWATDVAVPISKLVDMFETGKRDLKKLGVYAAVLGHIGDGNFHETILYNKKDPWTRYHVEDHVKRMTRLAMEMGGTCSGEHGIGTTKKDDLLEELGEETVDVMKKIKRALDPLALMNPGKIFDLQPQRETQTFDEICDHEEEAKERAQYLGRDSMIKITPRPTIYRGSPKESKRLEEVSGASSRTLVLPAGYARGYKTVEFEERDKI